MPAKTLLRYLLIFPAFVVISCQSPEPNAVGEIYLDTDALNAVDPATTTPMITLGRVLFYDRQLSVNNTIACASCHKQEYGFADNQKFSRGFESRVTSRNSMPIQNLFSAVVFETMDSQPIDPGFGFGSHFFWDGREQNLQSLVLQPVGNHIEMGITDVDALAQKIASLPYYTPLFQNAFGSVEVTRENISTALALFVQSINTFNTKFDRYNAAKFNVTETTVSPAKQAILNSLELEGAMLFEDKYDCNSCHQVQTPNGYAMFGGTFANIGLDKTYSDPGLAGVTGNPDDIGKFKIPSLRNVVFTAPYMHDGRFETLEDVLDHYSEGISDHPNLDDKLKDVTGHAKSMNITEHEREALIAFLNTLTDESVIKDPRYSNPFKVR